MNVSKFILIVLWIVFSHAWQPIGPGVEYQYLRYNDSNDAFIIRTDRTNPRIIIDTMVAGERVKGAMEVTSKLYERYDDSLVAWPNGKQEGLRYKAIAAVNGYYFNMSYGYWRSGGISNGWYVHRFDDMKAQDGFASGYSFKTNGSITINGCVKHNKDMNYIRIPNKDINVSIDGVNRNLTKDSLILYTPQYDITTPENKGTEYLLEVETSAGISNANKKVIGIIKKINAGLRSTIIPFDGLVISATGSREKSLWGLAVGDLVEIYQDMEILDEATCKNPIKDTSWINSFSALGGAYHYLRNGERFIYKDTIAHPRTAMAYNDKYIYFFVVDGRSDRSKGMTIDQLSEFAKNALDATDGVALDGGGSSTMIVDGKIKNVPSDGRERRVSNAVLIAVPMPGSQSSKFHEEDIVTTVTMTEVYAGPGNNYHNIGSVNNNIKGIVMDHTLSGALAKGKYWWKINFGEIIGWVDEKNLTYTNKLKLNTMQ